MSVHESARPTVAVLIPAGMRRQILTQDAERQLATMANVVSLDETAITSDSLPDLLASAVACLTGWGTPPLSDALLRTHSQLGLVAHTAGSIRRLVPESALARGLRVSHAANVIADAVAEQVIAGLLLYLRPLHEIDRTMRSDGEWLDVRERFPGRMLGSQTVGIVGAGYVGRVVIRLLNAFGCRVLVTDPLLDDTQAAALGVEPVDLHTLLTHSDIVSLHAPVLPQTKGMIGAAELRLLRDDAIFINTARAALVDETALLHELQSGRIHAILDVFDHEPLPPDSPFRTLPNVILSPHSAGHTHDTHHRQGQAMVDEIARFLRGESLQHAVTLDMLATMA